MKHFWHSVFWFLFCASFAAAGVVGFSDVPAIYVVACFLCAVLGLGDLMFSMRQLISSVKEEK